MADESAKLPWERDYDTKPAAMPWERDYGKSAPQTAAAATGEALKQKYPAYFGQQPEVPGFFETVWQGWSPTIKRALGVTPFGAALGFSPIEPSDIPAIAGATPPGMIYHEVKNALNPNKPPEGPLAGIAQGAVEQGKRAYEAAKQGEMVEAGGHGMAAALPGLGPRAAEAGEEWATPGHRLHAAGLTFNLLAPFAVAPVAGAVMGRLAQPFRTPPSEATLARQELGIPTTVPQYSDVGSWGRRMVYRFLGNRALGREPIFNEMQEQNTAAQAAAKRITGSLGPEASPLQTGTAVDRILKSQDEAQIQSLADAEQTRVNRINADNQAAVRRGEVMASDLRNQQAAAQAKATGDLQQTVASLGPVNSPEVTGQAVHAGTRANAAAFRAQARELYSRLDQKVGQAGLMQSAISTKPITDWMTKLEEDLGGVAGATAALKGVDVNALIQTAQRWRGAPKLVSFADAQDILSSLKSIGRDYKDLINSRYPGVIKRITGMLEDDMQAKAAKIGALNEYKEANSFYKAGVTTFNDSAAADMMEKYPEQVASFVWRPGAVTPMKEIQGALTGQPEAWRALQRRGVEDLLERSMKDGALDGKRLETEWAKLGPDMQKAMVGEGNWQNFTNQIKQLQASQIPVDIKGGPKFKVEAPQAVKLELTPQQAAIRTAASTKPEELAGQLLQPGGESFAGALRDSLRGQPQLWNQVRQQAFQKLTSNATGIEELSGSPILNPRKLIKDWRELGPELQSTIAGDQLPLVNKLMSGLNGLDLRKITTLATAIHGGLESLAVGGVMYEAGQALVHTLKMDLGSAALAGAGAASSVVWMLAPRYMAKFMTSPTGVKWLTEGLEIPAGTAEAGRWAAKMPLVGQATRSREQEPKPLPGPGIAPPPQ